MQVLTERCLISLYRHTSVQAFDELILLKRGGRTMYAGPTGYNSQHLIDYFQSIPDVPQIQEGINPGIPSLNAHDIPDYHRRL